MGQTLEVRTKEVLVLNDGHTKQIGDSCIVYVRQDGFCTLTTWSGVYLFPGQVFDLADPIQVHLL